ncbi:MAG TPA: VIT1/CCC1 transporter family protein [Acidimicrobiales bacterium]|nr:VIT1/CCC1 transporter family protein [Acidimicrobiales bacterium]
MALAHAGTGGSEHHHRNIQGGAARAAVFGVSDGLVSNLALVVGMAGAGPAPGVVRLAGLVGLLGGAFSMAAGEYVSMKAQTELLQRELELERIEIARRPDSERRELAQIYRSRGVASEVADQLAREMMADPELALQTHAREELGIDPDELGAPVRAATSSFGAFGVGALVPVLPWFFFRGTPAIASSIVAGAVAAIVIGLLLARYAERPPIMSALRQLAIAALAAGVPYLIGRAVGVNVS